MCVSTCVVDGVPHLVTIDAARLVGVIVLEDSLEDTTCESDAGRAVWLRRRISEKIEKKTQNSLLETNHRLCHKINERGDPAFPPAIV